MWVGCGLARLADGPWEWRSDEGLRYTCVDLSHDERPCLEYSPKARNHSKYSLCHGILSAFVDSSECMKALPVLGRRRSGGLACSLQVVARILG
jgi:hypothetical protein